MERTHDIVFASPGRRNIKALEREYKLREALQPEGPSVTLVHLAYQAASHELAAKGFDFSPSSIRDRWTAGGRDMASGLALLDGAMADRRRFRYIAVDPKTAGAAAEAGVAPWRNPVLEAVAHTPRNRPEPSIRQNARIEFGRPGSSQRSARDIQQSVP